MVWSILICMALFRKGGMHYYTRTLDILCPSKSLTICGDRAFLKFLRSNEELSGADDVPITQIAKLLSDRGVRVVILNACQSASEQGPDSSIVRSIVEAGVSIAVGMRYQILESAAEIFTETFYRSLLTRNQSIHAAVHAARFTMRNCQKRKTKFNTE